MTDADEVLRRAQEIATSAEATEPDLELRCSMLATATARAESELLAVKRILWLCLKARPALLSPWGISEAPKNPNIVESTDASGYREFVAGECEGCGAASNKGG